MAAILKKILIWACVVGLVVGAGLFAFHFYFVFGEGTKAGELNFVVYKGIIFKTYEGRLIQSGFNSRGSSRAQGGSIQSNEFNFSIKDKEIAEILMRKSGCMVQLHYKEFRGALPWRGHSKYVVDKIEYIKDIYEDGAPDSEQPRSALPVEAINATISL